MIVRLGTPGLRAKTARRCRSWVAHTRHKHWLILLAATAWAWWCMFALKSVKHTPIIIDAEAVVYGIGTERELFRYVTRFTYLSSRVAIIFFVRERVSISAAYGTGRVLAISLGRNKTRIGNDELDAMYVLSARISDRVKYVLRVDLDTFVSPDYIDLLSTLHRDPSVPLVTGEQNKVKSVDVESFYCSPASGVAYSRGILQSMRDMWHVCHKRGKLHQSQSFVVQECVQSITRAPCSQPSPSPRYLELKRRDLQLRIPASPSTDELYVDSLMSSAHVVHPLKADRDFQLLTYAAAYKLASPVTASYILRHAHADSSSLCVVNVYAQRQTSSCTGEWNGDTCSVELGRCTCGHRPSAFHGMPAIFVLSMPSKERTRMYNRTESLLQRAGFGNITRVLTPDDLVNQEIGSVAEWVREGHARQSGPRHARDVINDARANQTVNTAHPEYIPTLGEISYRAASKYALHSALSTDLDIFIISDDDVVLSTRFREDFTSVMLHGCGQFMSKFAGILLLGASEWNQRWAQIDKDTYQGCYDVHDRTFGAFGVMYNRRGALMILEQLRSRPNMPFDHAFYQAGLRGAFSAVIHPNLMIVDHRHKSSAVNNLREMAGRDEMDFRSERNKWNLSNYDFEDQARV